MSKVEYVLHKYVDNERVTMCIMDNDSSRSIISVSELIKNFLVESGFSLEDIKEGFSEAVND